MFLRQICKRRGKAGPWQHHAGEAGREAGGRGGGGGDACTRRQRVSPTSTRVCSAWRVAGCRLSGASRGSELSELCGVADRMRLAGTAPSSVSPPETVPPVAAPSAPSSTQISSSNRLRRALCTKGGRAFERGLCESSDVPHQPRTLVNGSQGLDVGDGVRSEKDVSTEDAERRSRGFCSILWARTNGSREGKGAEETQRRLDHERENIRGRKTGAGGKERQEGEEAMSGCAMD